MKKGFIIGILSLILCFCLMPKTSYAKAGTSPELNTYSFVNATKIALINDNVYVLDSGLLDNDEGHKLYNITTGDIIGGYGNQESKLQHPSLFAISGEETYIYSSTTKVIKSFSNGDYSASFFQYTKKDQAIVYFNSIVLSYAHSDIFNNIYFIDSTNGTIIKKAPDQTYFSQIETEGLSINANTKLTSDLLGNLYVINPISVNIITAEDTILYTVDLTLNSLDLDCQNNLYTFNPTTKKLTKTTLGETITSQDYILDISYTDFVIDKISGDVYFITSTEISKETLMVEENNFVINLEDSAIADNYLSTRTNTTPIKLAKTNRNVSSYDYPCFLGVNLSLSNNTTVYVMETNDKFSLCLITNQTNNNILTYIYSEYLTDIPNTQTAINKLVFNPTVTLYKFPSSLGTPSFTIANSLVYGNTVSVTRDLTDYKDKSGVSFYEIKLGENYYYINSLSVSNYVETSDGLKTNATIKTTNSSPTTDIYNEEGNKIGEIKNQTRIYVKSYDSTKNKTLINYVDEDNDDIVISAYVDTKYIEKDGISIELIIAISLAFICGIATIILLATNRKNR